MKFELTETVAVANPDQVLRVLERHLRAVAGDVEFEGGKLVAYGIGPSPRTINRRDMTVIAGRFVAGVTVLHVDVNYQASALLGNTPQDGIVRSKIEGAIDEMRGELRVWKPRTPVQEPNSGSTQDSPMQQSFTAPGTLQELRKFEGTGEPIPFASTRGTPDGGQTGGQAGGQTGGRTGGQAGGQTGGRTGGQAGGDSPLPSSAPPATIPATATELQMPAEGHIPAVQQPASSVGLHEREKAAASNPSGNGVSRQRPAVPLAEVVTVLPEKIAERMAKPETPVVAGSEALDSPAAKRRPIRLSKSKRTIGKRSHDVTDGATDGALGGDRESTPEAKRPAPLPAMLAERPQEVPLQSLLRSPSPQSQGSHSQDKDVESETGEPKRGRWALALGIVFVLLLAVVVAGYALRDVLPFPEPWKTSMATWSARAQAEFGDLKASALKSAAFKAVTFKAMGMGEKPVATPPAPVPSAPAEDVKPDTVTDPEVMVRPQTNVYLWLQDWASAMRSKDPVAQASYYATTVDRYLTDSSVTQAFVQEQKKTDIGNRKGLWTIKVEHMYIQRQTASEAQVKVVKHRIVQGADDKVVESFMKTRLRLVRADDTWKIVEEEDLK